jgi:RNase P/RNase MRP subunit p29
MMRWTREVARVLDRFKGKIMKKKSRLEMNLTTGKSLEVLRHRIGQDHREETVEFTPDFTYRDLKSKLDAMTEEQLSQQVQVHKSEAVMARVVRLDVAIAIDTVDNLFRSAEGELVQETRSSLDFKHHPEQVILLLDACPFSEKGDTMYEMRKVDGKTVLVGNRSGEMREFGR